MRAVAPERSVALTGRTLQVFADTFRVDVAGGQMEVFEVSGPHESGPPPHCPPWDEVYIGLDGEVEVIIGDTVATLRAGGAGVGAGWHRALQPDRERACSVQADHRRYWASALFVDIDANVPAGMPTPDRLPGIVEVARRNGLSSPLFA